MSSSTTINESSTRVFIIYKALIKARSECSSHRAWFPITSVCVQHTRLAGLDGTGMQRCVWVTANISRRELGQKCKFNTESSFISKSVITGGGGTTIINNLVCRLDLPLPPLVYVGGLNESTDRMWSFWSSICPCASDAAFDERQNSWLSLQQSGFSCRSQMLLWF